MEMELELTEIWRIIRQRFVMILSLVVIAVIVSGLVSFFVVKPVYEATATVLVQSQRDNKIDYAALSANQQLVKTYEEIIKSRLIAEDVIGKLNLNMTPEQLLGKVQVKADNGSLVTSITVTDQNPEKSVDIANGFAQSFYKNINSIMKVDNVSILDPAKLAAHPTPVSPKPYLNMAIAFVLGLMVGVGLAFLLEYLDKTVKTEDEVERLLGMPVLGVIGSFDAENKKNRKEAAVGGGVREVDGNSRQVNMPV